jgi:hypothetical protein
VARTTYYAVEVALATARIASRLHRANSQARIAESRDLRSSAQALRAEAGMVRRRAHSGRAGHGLW